MQRVFLFCWNAAEAAERAQWLRSAGYEAVIDVPPGPALLRAARSDPPAAVVVDLGRLPSQGRDVGVTLRCQKATRGIPLVFVGGDPPKAAAIRELLPDATYTDWPGVAAALAEAIARPPANPVGLESVFAGYAATPLPKKLGIKPGCAVALLEAPEGFTRTLGELPEGVAFVGAQQPCHLSIWFVRSQEELEAGMPRAVDQASQGPVWIAWAKQASGSNSRLTQPQIRSAGLAAGLVDYKVCAIDSTWSGLLFRVRSTRPAGA